MNWSAIQDSTESMVDHGQSRLTYDHGKVDAANARVRNPCRERYRAIGSRKCCHGAISVDRSRVESNTAHPKSRWIREAQWLLARTLRCFVCRGGSAYHLTCMESLDSDNATVLLADCMNPQCEVQLIHSP